MGQISSTEIRKRITDAKKKIVENSKKNGEGADVCESPEPFFHQFQEQTSMNKEQNYDDRVKMYPSYLFYDIAGLCTKSTIDYIVKNKLY